MGGVGVGGGVFHEGGGTVMKRRYQAQQHKFNI